MNTRHTLLPLLLVLGAVSLASGCKQHAGAPPEVAEREKDAVVLADSARLGFIKIEPVASSKGGPLVMLTGRVAFDEDHTQRVASPLDGRATAIQVKLGDKVKVGQSVIELSSPMVGQFQADAQKAGTDLSLGEKEFQRAKRLLDAGAGAEKDVVQTESDVRKAKAELARANAHLRSLGLSASDPSVGVAIRARVGGTVVERNVLLGQEVRADSPTPLLTIANLEIVWVYGDVYEQDLALVKSGAQINVRVAAYSGETFPGTIGSIGDVVDPGSRTVKIRCVVPNPDGRLKPEMFAKIELRESQVERIYIPANAVMADSREAKVIVAETDKLFRLRTIEIGPEVEGKVRVLSGLKAGESIVTDGALFLKNEIDSR